MLARQIAVLRADAERRRDGDVREPESARHLTHEPFGRFGRHLVFPGKDMEHRTARIKCLQRVLLFKHLIYVVRVPDRKVRGVGIVGLRPALRPCLLVGGDDIRITLRIDTREPVGRTLGRGSFEIVDIACLLLKLRHHFAHEGHHLAAEGTPLLGGYRHAEKIQAAFVHAVDADGGEMVFPEAMPQ